jgi:hypothetical protein
MKHLSIAVSIALFLTLAPTLSLAKNGDIIKRGQCSTGENTKLKAGPENGQIEIEYELDDAVPGSRWRITITKNGKTILRTTQRANAAGNIDVRTLTSNLAGREKIRAKAKRIGAAGACALSLSAPF